MSTMSGSFTLMDYAIFIGTLGVSMLIGIYYACVKKQKTNSDLLMGGRTMPIIPTSLSLLATYVSAITILGFSGEIYSHGTLIVEFGFGALFWIPVGGFLFLPTLYRLRLTSAYEYLSLRFNSPVVRLLATGTFVLQILLYMGVVIFAPSLALSAVVDLPVWISILAVGGCAAVYTSIGGIKAVVFTDCFQILMMFAGMLSIIIKGSTNVGGLTNAFKIVDDHGRFELLNRSTDPFLRHTSLYIFIGQGLYWISSYGTHQTTVQRYCSMPSLKQAFIALLCTGPLVMFTMTLAAVCGVTIFANFAGCDPITLGFIKRSDQIAPYFVLQYLSPISGLMGLFIACLYSGALSTVSSGLNSLAAVTWEEVSRIKYLQTLNEGQQARVTKIIGLIYGGIIIGIGFLAGSLGGVLNAAIVVNGTVSGPVLGVFLLGVLVPFANKKGAISGMLAAHIVSFGISIGAKLMNPASSSLPLSIDNCSNETIAKVSNFTDIYLKHQSQQNIASQLSDVEWPAKIFTISYVLYPVIGTMVTVIVGSLVSIFTDPSQLTEDQEKYIHPLIVYVNQKLRKRTGYQVSRIDTLAGKELLELHRNEDSRPTEVRLTTMKKCYNYDA